MARRDWLLVRSAYRGSPAGLDPVRVQKAMFLFARSGVVPPGQQYEFRPSCATRSSRHRRQQASTARSSSPRSPPAVFMSSKGTRSGRATTHRMSGRSGARDFSRVPRVRRRALARLIADFHHPPDGELRRCRDDRTGLPSNGWLGPASMDARDQDQTVSRGSRPSRGRSVTPRRALGGRRDRADDLPPVSSLRDAHGSRRTRRRLRAQSESPPDGEASRPDRRRSPAPIA